MLQPFRKKSLASGNSRSFGFWAKEIRLNNMMKLPETTRFRI
jgi:hypothetical protein